MSDHDEKTIVKVETFYNDCWVKLSIELEDDAPLNEILKIKDEGEKHGKIFIERLGGGGPGDDPPPFP